MVVKVKGFVYIVEVSFAIFIFSFSIWSSISSIDVKSFWEANELIYTGIAVSNILNSYDINKLLENPLLFSNITEYSIPDNMYWGIEIKGTPKSLIEIGCANCTGRAVLFLRNILTPVYYNERFVNFTVTPVTFTSLNDVKNFDVLIFINFTNFDSNNLIQEYLKNGGKIIAITDILANELENLDDTFSLKQSQVNVNRYSEFTSYLDTKPFIQKYFIGTGFRIEAKTTVENRKQGAWKIWLNEKEVNINPSLSVEIEGIGTLNEGDVFSLNARAENPELPNKNYYFRIKKVFPEEVYIQPLNTSFVFPQIVESYEVKVEANNGKNVISSRQGNRIYSPLIVNTTTSRAIWMSYFPQSSEFELLLKSAIISINDVFVLKTFFGETGISIPIYTSTCCDIPEALEINLKLGYKY